MKRKWWLLLIACMMCVLTLFACKKEDKPWYGTYFGIDDTDFITINKDYVVTKNGKNKYKVNDNVLEIEGYSRYPVFLKDYNVLSFQALYFSSDVGYIPVESGYFSATLLNMSNNEYYVFESNGNYRYLTPDQPAYSQQGRYKLKNGVLKLEGRYLLSKKEVLKYCLVEDDGYELDCLVYVKNADSYFGVEGSNQNGTQNSSGVDGGDSSSSHTHEYVFKDLGNGSHGRQCACGAITDEQSHSYKTKRDSVEHWQECTCGAITGEQSHSYQTKRDSVEHWQECTCGAITDEAAHSFDALVAVRWDNQHYYQCECGSQEEAQSCKYILDGKDETYHWKECICGNVVSKTKHGYTIFKEENGYYWSECSCGMQTEKIQGLSEALVYTLSGDGTFYAVSAPNTSIHGHAVIASTYNGLPVTTIARNAFKDCVNLQEVTIPNSVTTINEYAFSNCNRLKTVTVPDSVTEIWDGAFESCDRLFEVKLGTGISRIREGVFSGSSIVKVNIPNGVKIIEEEAFRYCDKLTNVVLPDSVTDVKAYAFNTSGLTSITLGANIANVEDYAFYECYKLIEVVNKSSLSIVAGGYGNGDIGRYAKQVLTDEAQSNIIEREGYLFYNDGGVYSLLGYTGTETDLVLPDKIDGHSYNIYQYAFRGMNLTSVLLSDNVTGIGHYAFYDVWGLSEIIIPESVVTMESYVFYNNSENIIKIYVVAEHEPDSWSRSWDYGVSSENIVWGYQKATN